MTDINIKYKEIRSKFLHEMILLLENTDQDMSIACFEVAMKNLNLDPNYYLIIYPNGITEVIKSLALELNIKMISSCSSQDQNIKSIRLKIARALEEKIIDSVNFRAQSKIISYLSKIDNLQLRLTEASDTCDFIWRYAGDKSTDFNYYSKRGLLITVYLRAQSFYLTDNSPNYSSTRIFIKNALDNIINIASFKNKIKLPQKHEIPFLRLFS